MGYMNLGCYTTFTDTLAASTLFEPVIIAFQLARGVADPRLSTAEGTLLAWFQQSWWTFTIQLLGRVLNRYIYFYYKLKIVIISVLNK